MIRGGCYSCAWRRYSEELDCQVCGHPNFPEEDYICNKEVEDCFYYELWECPEDY